jgi:hypothetical protein
VIFDGTKDLGMKILTFTGILIGFALTASAQLFDQTHAAFNHVLKTHVVDGQVDYEVMKADPQPLAAYLMEAGMVKEPEFNTWNQSEQLSFLINLYNAATLQLILDHYPVKSIKKIGSLFKGPWDQPSVSLFGNTITLNDLEHGIIRKRYNEPRIHMALVCAAQSCPPLRSEVYTADQLDIQLDDQSRIYLASPDGLVIDRAAGVVRISSIFKWYGDDFSSVEGFIEKHSGESIKGLKIRYLNYDWSLNERIK